MKYIKKYHKYIGLFGCLLIAISCFLPFIKYSILNINETNNFFNGDGKLVLAINIITILLILFNKDKTSLISTVSIVVILIQNILTINKDIISIGKLGYIHFSIGFYLLIAGIVICIVYPFLPKEKNIS
ncbi:MAG: hypothetical protein E7158_02230 [Firmicutes bacterium]|nr:hypothetical protein [Bacillota bacterium]